MIAACAPPLHLSSDVMSVTDEMQGRLDLFKGLMNLAVQCSRSEHTCMNVRASGGGLRC